VNPARAKNWSPAIHALSSRRDKVFVRSLHRVPKELSEVIFSAFVAARSPAPLKDSAGVIRTAVGGTLFLDEIATAAHVQRSFALLRKARFNARRQRGEGRRADHRRDHSDLEEMVAQGSFREDLTIV